MFGFQKLEVYRKALTFNKDVKELVGKSQFDRVTCDQLRRASFSIMLNIAEGFELPRADSLRDFHEAVSRSLHYEKSHNGIIIEKSALNA